MAAQLADFAEVLVVQDKLRADMLEGTGQLIVVRVAAGQAVVINEDSQFPLAHRRAVQMRQVVHGRTGSMHRGLIDEMDLAKQSGVARHLGRQVAQTAKEWALGWIVILGDFLYRRQKPVADIRIRAGGHGRCFRRI